MNTEYAVGNFRMHFEARASRRWFVALFYAVLAAFGLAGFSAHANTTIGEWIVAGCGILFTALAIIFTWIAGDTRTHGDEREIHRRDHAHYMAHRILLYGFAAPALALALRGSLMQLPRSLWVAALMFFVSLPQSILLWTEPDMETES